MGFDMHHFPLAGRVRRIVRLRESKYQSKSMLKFHTSIHEIYFGLYWISSLFNIPLHRLYNWQSIHALFLFYRSGQERKRYLSCLSGPILYQLGDNGIGRSQWNTSLLQSLPSNLLDHVGRAPARVDDALDRAVRIIIRCAHSGIGGTNFYMESLSLHGKSWRHQAYIGGNTRYDQIFHAFESIPSAL